MSQARRGWRWGWAAAQVLAQAGMAVALLVVALLAAAGCGGGAPQPRAFEGQTQPSSSAATDGLVVVAVQDVSPAPESLPVAEPAPPAAAPESHDGPAAIGERAPTVSVQDLSGEGPDNLREARGMVVIVDFWASYCMPCAKTMPFYQRLMDRHRGEVAVIGVKVDSVEDLDDAGVMNAAQRFGARYSIARDTGLVTASRYMPPKMPTAYFIDRKGILRFIHGGFTAQDESIIEREVAELVAER